MRWRHSAPSSRRQTRHQPKPPSFPSPPVKDESDQCRSQTEDPLKMQKPACLHREQILIIKSPPTPTEKHTYVRVNLETAELFSHEA